MCFVERPVLKYCSEKPVGESAQNEQERRTRLPSEIAF